MAHAERYRYTDPATKHCIVCIKLGNICGFVFDQPEAQSIELPWRLDDLWRELNLANLKEVKLSYMAMELLRRYVNERHYPELQCPKVPSAAPSAAPVPAARPSHS